MTSEHTYTAVATRAARRAPGKSHRLWLPTLIFAVAMTSVSLRSTPAYAEGFFPTEYRATESIGKHDDVSQYALVFHGRPPRRLFAERMELAIGSLSGFDQNRWFVSYGAVWRMPRRWMPFARDAMHVDFGFSPTWIAGSTVNGRDLGGNLHFTSSISVGAYLNGRRTLELSARIQHTSNGGLDSDNPGIDMLGLSLVYRAR